MGGSSSSSSSRVSTSTEDRRVAAQDDGLAISAGDGDVIVDMVPDAILDYVRDTTSGAYDLVARSADTASDAMAIAAGREMPAQSASNSPVVIAAVALAGAYLLTRAK